jgi:hypothetical protein
MTTVDFRVSEGSLQHFLRAQELALLEGMGLLAFAEVCRISRAVVVGRGWGDIVYPKEGGFSAGTIVLAHRWKMQSLPAARSIAWPVTPA